VAAAAVADQRGLSAAADGDRLQAQLERIDGAVRAVDVAANAGLVRLVADPAEPAPHHREGGVAGQEARDEEHRRAVPAAQALAPEDRGDHKPGELQLPAQLAEVVAPPALRRAGRGAGRLRVEGGSVGGDVVGAHAY
jgi:hypothetical protein